MEASSSRARWKPVMEAGSWSEVRIEPSAAIVGFSDICHYCGNRKRRCLLPPTRSRKKVLIFESAAVVSPPSSPTRPVMLRPESSPLAFFCNAGLSVTPSQPPHSPFLRSHPAFAGNVELAAEAFRSSPIFPPPTVAPSPHPVPDFSKSTPLAAQTSDFSKSTSLAAKTDFVVQGALNVNIKCGRGVVCKALISNP